MRRIVWMMVSMAVVTGSGTASGQDLFVGVKGGVMGARAAVTGTEGFDTSARPGGAVGVFAGFDVGHGVRLQPEALFTVRRFSSNDLPLHLSIETRAIEIPVLVVKGFNASRRIRPFLSAGPQLNLITAASQTFGTTESDIRKDLRGADFGVTFGGGIETPAGRGAVVIEGRANIGFRDLTVASTSSARSRAVAGLVGYRF